MMRLGPDVSGVRGEAVAQDVFVSYSSRDKPVADAVCASLEGRGIRCWIAPRDILPGTDWGEAIIRGIEGSKLMVLVFSSNANASQQIKREVERAVNKGLPIVPLRIEDVVPERSLEYFLSSPHWLDALTPPLEKHLVYLGETVATLLLSPGEEPAQGRAWSPAAPVRSRGWSGTGQSRVLLGVAAVAIVAASIFGLRALLSSGDDAKTAAPPGTTTETAEPTDKRFFGQWHATSSSGGLTQTLDSRTAETSRYTTTVTFSEAGQIVFPDSQSAGIISPSGGQQRVFHWSQSGDTASLVYELLPAGVAQYIQGSSPKALADYLGFGAQTTWRRVARSSASDTWELDVSFGGAAWKMQLIDTPSGSYTFTATSTDTGQLFASNGKLKIVSDAQGLLQGDYQFTDNDTVAINLNGASVLWKRVK